MKTLNNKADINVSGCVFQNNGINGGKVSLLLAYSGQKRFSIDRCVFINNTATIDNMYGIVSNCVFNITPNIAPGIKIHNSYDGIFLENNTITSDYGIYARTNVQLLDDLRFIVLNNETVNCSLNEEIQITAVLLDDNNNRINHQGLKLTINGIEQNTTTFDTSTGMYKLAYTPNSTGFINVSGICEKIPGIQVYNGTLLVKTSPELVLNPIANTTYGNNVTIAANLNNNAVGNLTFLIGNLTYNSPIVNGSASRIFEYLNAGNHTVIVTYSGDDNYGPSSVNGIFEISKADSTIDLRTDNVFGVGDNVTVVATLPFNAKGNVTFRLVNSTRNKTITLNNSNIVSISFDGLSIGSYMVIANYSGDNNYNPSNEHNVSFNVIMLDADLDVNYSDVQIGSDVIVTAKVKEDATGNITFIVNDILIENKTINNGTANITLSNIEGGRYNIKVVYTGDNRYLPCTKVFSLDVIVPTPYELLDPEFNVNVINTTIIASTNVNATGKVFVTVDGRGFYGDLLNGQVSIEIDNLISGQTYTALVSYSGDENFTNASKSLTITVPSEAEPINPNMSISILNTTIIVNLPVNATGGVFIKVDDNTYYVNLVDGKAVLNISGLEAGENYTVFVTYSGDDIYANVSESVNITVPPKPKPINPNMGCVVQNTTVVVSLPIDATGNVFVNIGNKSYYATINNGNVSIFIDGLIKGQTHIGTIIYSGDSKYEGVNQTFSIVVPEDPKPITPSMNVKVVNTTLNIQLPTDATGNVFVNIGNKGYYAPVNNGIVIIDVFGLSAGSYSGTIVYGGDSKYEGVNQTFNLVVPPKPEPIVPIMNVSVLDNSIGINLPVDAKGIILVDVEGKGYITLVKNGKAGLTLYDLGGGNHTATIYYVDRSNKYNDTSAMVNVFVPKSSSVVVKAPSLIKYYGSSDRFSVIVSDDEGNPLVNKGVSINIHGMAYNRTTDSKGVASLGINLNPGEYSVFVECDGVLVKSKVVVKSTVSGRNITKYFRNGTQYTAMFLDSSGSLLKNTFVDFNIYGVFYKRKTDDSGVAQLNINLSPGSYIITARNPVSKELYSNKIVVLPKLVSENVNMKYLDGSQYKVKVLDSLGNPLKHVVVSLNIYGVFYNRETDDSGVASLNIRLMPGEYIITAMYGDSSTSNTIKIS